MPGRPGRAAHGEEGARAVGKERGEVIGLQRPHRPADGEGNAVDAQSLREETLLADHVVVHGHVGKVCAPLGSVVTGRRGDAVAEEVGDDDEPSRRIERPARADESRIVRVRTGVIRREEDRIVAPGARCPEGRVDQPRAAEHFARLQREVPEVERVEGARRGGHPTSLPAARASRVESVVPSALADPVLDRAEIGCRKRAAQVGLHCAARRT